MQSNQQMNKKKGGTPQNPGRKAKKRGNARRAQLENRKEVKKINRKHRTKDLSVEQLGQLLPTQDSRIQITAEFLLDAYRNCFVSLAAFLAQKNKINVDTDAQPNQWVTIYDGLAYMMQQGGSNLKGAEVALNKLPKVYDYLFQALRPKKLRYQYGEIAYGLRNFDTTALSLGAFPLFGHQWGPTYVSTDVGSYNQPAVVYNPFSPNSDHYSGFLASIDALHDMLKTVEWESTKELKYDVSAYARTYSYVGLKSTSTSGARLDVENEVEVRAPSIARFVPYFDNPGASDPRIPGDLAVSSLDAASVTGFPLHNSWTSWFNKTPPRINHVDFDQIYTVLCLWMLRLKQKAREQNRAIGFTPLPFTAQDLQIVLRNALIQVFDTQYFMQFNANNDWAINDNAFLPFFVMAHNSGNDIFGNFKLPTILAENLGALRARKVTKTTGSKVNCETFIPVVGRYYLDELPVFNIVLDDGTSSPLFAPAGGQNSIDLTDCTEGNIFVYTQGTYYKTVMEDWNSIVDQLKDLSSPVQPILGDAGPRGLLLTMTTRVQRQMLSENIQRKNSKGISGPPPRQNARVAQSVKQIQNRDYAVADPKGPKALEPASLLSMFTDTITSKVPITSEMMELCNVLILPTDRISQTDDVLNRNMIQVMGKQPYQYNNTGNAATTGTGAGEFARLDSYAGEMIAGVGRDITSKFQQVFDKLIRDGEAGALASLLGGVAKSIFPGAAPVVDVLSSVLPF